MSHFAPSGFEISDKRQRVVTVSRPKRPIDKTIVVINQVGVGTTDQSTQITLATYPQTMVGLRWDLSFEMNNGTLTADAVWAIIYLREGETLDNLTFGDQAAFYQPESSVLVYGYAAIFNFTETKHIAGTTKAMRKMQVGDTIQFIIKCESSVEKMTCKGAIQLFAKG